MPSFLQTKETCLASLLINVTIFFGVLPASRWPMSAHCWLLVNLQADAELLRCEKNTTQKPRTNTYHAQLHQTCRTTL